MIRLPRAIRFDDSDDHVFPKAALPGEWAVSGAFAFSSCEQADLTGKPKQAFANGFLALGSFGWATFVSVAETSKAELDLLTDVLADHLVEVFGAPDRTIARRHAAAELDFVMDLCRDAPINTIFAVQRGYNEDKEVRETFRIIQAPQGPVHTRIWDVVPE